ncbi:baseplate J/gp47 family protein [Nocardioides soli]|uniref:Putative phage protein gp47/JayE n=1 Tax=Nocardioides soli TaxID=1036020 RepID=A0A7W4VSL5_9ACTN|nr:baseplate J/gp47 family protein [Nocardioides soli]MBB3041031.1 putative phage protein gp47/JayE [Nocardioides soli]
MAWEPPELPEDQDEVIGRILDNLQDRMDGWAPYDGQPEVALAQEIGRETVVVNARMRDQIEYAVAGIGSTVFDVPYALATTAAISVQLTVTGTGVVVPDGFMVTGTNPVGEDVNFVLLEPVTAATTTPVVTMHAADAGSAGNGVPVGPLSIITATSTVITASAVTASAGGSDDELRDTYLDRLVSRLSVLRPGGVLAADMAALARTVPGVTRALGIDNYDALSEAIDAEKTVSVFVIDNVGAPVSVGVKADVQDALEAVREPGFVIYVEDPTYTAVDVVYDVVADAGADPGEVAAAIEAAVLAYLDPATWGTTVDDDTTWQAAGIVRLFDVAATIGRVPGVAAIVSVTLNGAAADAVLAGPAALPAPADAVDPTTVAGTVS